MRTYDAVVIGAGPAGLSAAASLSREGSCLLIEQGPPAGARQRDVATDVLAGVGGAGLFSDGKHSFFPAASALWALPDRAALEGAFDRTAEVLRPFGVDAGAFPREPAPVMQAGAWRAKEYRSVYVPLATRHACIESLWARAADRLTGARVTGAGRAGKEIVVTVSSEGAADEIATRHLVVAGGRWSSRWTRSWLETLGAGFAFRRMEFGARLETGATNAAFARLPGVDGKLRFVEEGSSFEYRTFCTCRDGEVVLGEAGGLRAFSGRADVEPTGRSNVGLLVRTSDAMLGAEVSRAIESSSPVTLDLRECSPSTLAPTFGNAGARALWAGLQRFLEHCPEFRDGRVLVHAPCLEGIGEYAVDDGALRIADGVWIAGDAGGRFRGIVAAMISGHYAAARITSAARG